MSKKVIHLNVLSAKSIDKAIRDLEEWQRWLEEKTKEFVSELAKEGMAVASARFASAQYDGTNDVSVHIEERGEFAQAVVATGEATLFIEFGTGITYPDNHPEQMFTRGGYGYGLGRLPGGWMYDGDPGTNGEVITEGKYAGRIHTYGNPANMAMYEAKREIESKFEEIARRVFA